MPAHRAAVPRSTKAWVGTPPVRGKPLGTRGNPFSPGGRSSSSPLSGTWAWVGAGAVPGFPVLGRTVALGRGLPPRSQHAQRPHLVRGRPGARVMPLDEPAPVPELLLVAERQSWLQER